MTSLEVVMVDLAFWDDSFEQDRSWDDFGTTISDIWGTHQNYIANTGSGSPKKSMVRFSLEFLLVREG